MIILQIIGLLIIVTIANITAVLLFTLVKHLFFVAYIKDRKKNAFYNNFNWIEITAITVLVLIALLYYFTSKDQFPNQGIITFLAIALQAFIIYKAAKSKPIE